MSVLGAGEVFMLGAADEADAYVIPKSLRFNSGDSAHLTRTPASDGNRRTWTWSAWVKRASLGGYQSLFADQVSGGTNGAALFFTLDNSIRFEEYTGGGFQWKLQTSQVFRDCSAWMHLVVVFDSPAPTADERMRIYVNGSEVTDFAARTNPSQNFEGSLNRARITDIASYGSFDTSYFNGYLADIQYVDGQALAPTDFGETRSSDGVWVPKKFADSGPNSGVEWSSNSTNFTNPGRGFNGNSGDYAEVSSSGAKGTFTFPSSITAANNVTFAFSSGTSGNLFVNDSSTAMQGTSFQVQTISFTGTLTKVSLQSSSQPVLYYLAVDGVPLIDNLSHNYGRNGFHLNFSDNSSNQALGLDSAPTINLDPKKGFDVVTYTGNGSIRNIGGLLFEPGLTWLKTRTGHGAKNHTLFDSVRGPTKFVSSDKELRKHFV